MVKAIKVIHLAPGESVLITAALGLRHLVRLPQAVLMSAANQNSSMILMQNRRRKRSSLFFALHELTTEPLEQTYERIEQLREIQAVLQDIPPQQRERFILHFAYGYSYSEIAKMQGCHKAAVMRSAKSALKKSVKIWLPDYQLLPVFSPNHAVFLLYIIYYRLLLRRAAQLLR